MTSLIWLRWLNAPLPRSSSVENPERETRCSTVRLSPSGNPASGTRATEPKSFAIDSPSRRFPQSNAHSPDPAFDPESLAKAVHDAVPYLRFRLNRVMLANSARFASRTSFPSYAVTVRRAFPGSA